MSQDAYVPPYTMTETMLALVAEIAEEVGSITAWQHRDANPQLRRDSRIRTIHASLAIENNSLSLDQVTDIINGKRVLGAPAEIREVKNAYEAYEQLLSFDPYSTQDLLRAHAILMAGLHPEAGSFRTGGVGVFKGAKIVHMAPPASMVREHMENLLHWAETSMVHPLVKSCVFHYEFEFIHPFADGNGRMGRMWNTLLLYQWKPLFAWIPVETIIRERQNAYYAALGQADSTGNATPFVEFLLQAMLDTLKEVGTGQPAKEAISPALQRLLDTLGNEALPAMEIMSRMGLRNRASFRKVYLQPALLEGLIEMTIPHKPNSKLQKYRKP